MGQTGLVPVHYCGVECTIYYHSLLSVCQKGLYPVQHLHISHSWRFCSNPCELHQHRISVISTINRTNYTTADLPPMNLNCFEKNKSFSNMCHVTWSLTNDSSSLHTIHVKVTVRQFEKIPDPEFLGFSALNRPRWSHGPIAREGNVIIIYMFRWYHTT